MAILNYTTSIKADKTIWEINSLLAKRGAHQILTEYDNGLVVGISFMLKYNEANLLFRLPANWRGVQKALVKQKVSKNYRTDEHAINVCWRIIKDWIQAQCAIIEAEQADLATVFLPYAVMNNKQTVSENFLRNEEGKQFLLEPKN